MMPVLLEAKDLSVGYTRPLKPNFVVSSGIDLIIRPGEFLCLLGPNGAGKSTLLRTLAGEQLPLGGTVHLDGEDVHAVAKTELARLVSVVLTEKITSSLITVFDLVAMGRIPYTNWLGTLRAEDQGVIEESLSLVGAQDLRNKRLSDLSDGERQRCMLARALAQRPKLLVLDEITAFLDLPRRIEMMHRLQQLAHETQVAVLLSTHDLDLALANADRILLQPSLKPLIEAGPEDLVLSGAFESAFESEGLIFDKLSGSFSRARTLRGTVRLEARGVEGYWAQRALERMGFSCEDGSAGAQTTVRFAEQGKWELVNADKRQSFPTLSSVVAALVSEADDTGKSMDS